MTNPDNIVRVRARNGGRASVYEANGWAQAYSEGLLEGNGVVQNTSADMSVLVGGSATKPDVVLAKNPAGYKIALDLVGQQAVTLTAPASNSRISAVVAYTDDLSLSTDETTTTGSPASCGLIVVNGTAAATPSAPTDAQIRSAITSDGATGSQASYAIIATVEVASSTTIITSSLIKNNQATLGADKIDFPTMKLPAPSTEALHLYDQITSNTVITAQQKGFLVGKALVPDNCNGGAAYIQINGNFVGGIPYCGSGVHNLQIVFTIPVNVGTRLNFSVANGGKFEAVKLISSDW